MHYACTWGTHVQRARVIVNCNVKVKDVANSKGCVLAYVRFLVHLALVQRLEVRGLWHFFQWRVMKCNMCGSWTDLLDEWSVLGK